jgi:hypothetical protein
VYGPNANDKPNMMGGYVNQHPRFIRTIFEGLTDEAPLSNVILHSDPACNTTACPSFNATSLHALASSDACAVNILALGLTAVARAFNGVESGGNACGCPAGDAVEGECCDRMDVRLPGAQLQMLHAVVAAAAGMKPTVLVTVNAGMIELNWAAASTGVGAIINSIYQGQTTGVALARAIFGVTNPGARLPIT